MATMDNRRQSGLWAQNPTTGYYEQASSSNQGPYQYYQPPSRKSTEDSRRSFSERAGNTYAPPPETSNAPPTATQNGAPSKMEQQHRKFREMAKPQMQKLHDYMKDIHGHSHTTSAHLAQVQHVNSTDLPGSAQQEPFRFRSAVDPNNDVPDNVRSKPWSPDLPAAATAPKQEQIPRQTAPASEPSSGVPMRRGSVPDRSPLQKLEGDLDDMGKRHKRAKMEEAEYRARQKSLGRTVMPAEGDLLRQGTLRSEKGRVVSDGSRRTSESTSDRYYKESPRQVPAERFQKASEALKQETSPPVNSGQYVTAGSTNPGARDAMPQRDRSLRQPRQDPGIVKDPRPYHHAPEAPRDLGVTDQYPTPSSQPSQRERNRAAPSSSSATSAPTSSGGANLNRSASGKYKHRLRDAGFAGAAAAVAGTGAAVYESTAADRGKAAYERRKGQQTQEQPQGSPISPTTGGSAEPGGRSRSGSNSKRLQKAYPSDWPAGRSSQDRSSRDRGIGDKQALQNDRLGSSGGRKERAAASANQDPDPISRKAVAAGPSDPIAYNIPNQTAAGQQAREQVNFGNTETSPERRQRGFGAETSPVHAQAQEKHHKFGGMFHRNGHSEGATTGPVGAAPLEEWRNASIARLNLQDLEFENEGPAGATRDGKDAAWWDRQGNRRSSSSASRGPQVQSAQLDGPYEEEARLFQPPLFLTCGPLLRYTGMRKEKSSRSGGADKEIWRGSVMVVTEDEHSEYSSAPTLRIFAQPMDLFTPPPRHMQDEGHGILPEFEDPVAGQVKMSRSGRPLYVRPVHDIDGEVDLSRVENNQGLFSVTRTPMLGPQFSGGPDGRQSQHITFQDKSRIKRRDGEKAGRYREVKAVRLHTERGFTFWRFNLEIELGSDQHRVAYRINKGPALGFWVPARGESMNVMFHSCNGFSLSVDSRQFSGPDPLWRDVLNRHQARPFHVMLGGGDQIYNDAATRDTELFREWTLTKNPEHKHSTQFTPEIQDELETFYLQRYSMWFSQGLFGMANSQIPMVNLWDDHDIIDGFGSYPDHFMSTHVFTGLGAVAFKYYMLFQHQSLPSETTKEEPSWLLGASPGPYINQLSRSVFLHLGRKVAFLGLDCRTERTRGDILSQETYDIVFDRARAEIVRGETRHLLVLLGVPIAYPRLNFLENILTSRAIDPIKAIGRTGMLGGFVNKFDGGVEILDDLDDHWTAKHHKAERNWFIQELQELAAEKSVRVTILGGDVHLGAIGQFYTPKKFGVGKDRDHRYMPNVISSAIVNTPPPTMMADVLNRRNKVHHLDHETDEDMIPMFEVDVDGKARNNKCLLPRRNYCMIREFVPGTTPPSTPPSERESGPPQEGYDEAEERDRRFPPGSMRRTMSLTRGPARLVRRLSGSSKSRNPPISLPYGSTETGPEPGMGRSNSLSGPRPDSRDMPPKRPTNMFHRRATNISEKEIRRVAARGGAPDEDEDDATSRQPGHINLQGGLDISLNMEINQHDPSGLTERYRLLVPALWYEGPGDANTAHIKGKKAAFMDRFRGRGKRDVDGEEGDYSRSPSRSPPPSQGQGQEFRGSGEQGVGVSGTGRMPSKQSYGADGAYDDDTHNGAGPTRRSMDQSGAAYDKGYKLSSPPIGSTATQQQQSRPPPTNSYPPASGSNYRRASAPQGPPSGTVSQKHTQHLPRDQDEYSDGSLTPSDAYEDADEGPPGRTPGVQPRRLSKAERFFGIGDDTGRRPSAQYDESYVDGGRPAKKKPNWMIWK